MLCMLSVFALLCCTCFACLLLDVLLMGALESVSAAEPPLPPSPAGFCPIYFHCESLVISRDLLKVARGSVLEPQVCVCTASQQHDMHRDEADDPAEEQPAFSGVGSTNDMGSTNDGVSSWGLYKRACLSCWQRLRSIVARELLWTPCLEGHTASRPPAPDTNGEDQPVADANMEARALRSHLLLDVSFSICRQGPPKMFSESLPLSTVSKGLFCRCISRTFPFQSGGKGPFITFLF
jgi:hypothetical protein